MKLLKSFLSFEQTWTSDKKRKSYLLNLINFLLLVILLFLIFISFFIDNKEYLWNLVIAFAMLLLASFLVKKGLVCPISLMLIGILIVVSMNENLLYKFNLHIIHIIYSLIILFSALLIRSGFSFIILILVCLSIFKIYFDSGNFDSSSTFSFFSLVFSYTLLTILSWISSRQLEKSFANVKLVSEELKTQNENFEYQVKNRTEKLKSVQLNQLTQIAPLLDLGKFSAGLIHDIRQPLSVLSLILQEAKNNNNYILDLNLALEALNKIEDLSNISSTKLFSTYEQEIFNLNFEIKRLLSLFKYNASKKHIRIILSNNCDYDLHADRKILLKILTNLILNAIEAYDKSTKQEKEIFIKVNKNSRYLYIVIKDYGVGISRDNIKKLFIIPSFSTKDKRKSLGIGLYISQELMKKVFESNIKVESSAKYGTSFILPIKNKFLLATSN